MDTMTLSICSIQTADHIMRGYVNSPAGTWLIEHAIDGKTFADTLQSAIDQKLWKPDDGLYFAGLIHLDPMGINTRGLLFTIADRKVIPGTVDNVPRLTSWPPRITIR